MNLPTESSLCLNGIKYSLIKSKPIEGEGYVLIVDEPDKAEERSFVPTHILRAISLLTKQNK